MRIYLFAVGLVSILGQVVLLRELNISFYGIELIYLIAIGIWLFWTAAGAIIGKQNNFPSPDGIAVLFLVFAITIPLDIVFIRDSRLIFGGIPGAYLTFLQQLIVAIIAILPAGLLSGLLFQWSAKAYVTNSGTLAAAYAYESVGGLIGGLFSSLFIMWELCNFSTALLCAIVSVIAPLMVLKSFRRSLLFRVAILMVGITSVFLLKASSLDHQMTLWNHPHLLESADSPYGRITVTRLYNQISVFENDSLSFETEGTDAEYFCHLAALQHPNPKRVLILGGGIEGTIREIEKYAPERIDYVELNPIMIKLVTRYLPDDIRRSLGEPCVHMIFADPRAYLKKSETYDLILVGMPEPSSGQTNRFYTREFFEQCAAKLNPGGILGFRLRTAENLWTVPLRRRNASIYRALQSVFPYVLFFPGATNIVTASCAPLPCTPETMSLRLLERRIKTRLISPDYIHYLFTNDRFFRIKDLLKNEKAVANTDIRPVCYQYTFLIWLSKFFPAVAHIDPSTILDKGLFKPPLIFFWAGLPIIFILCTLRPDFSRIILVATAGFIGMVLETILILYYQVKHGVLYQDIGLLLMSFMAGLALGAVTINKVMLRPVDSEAHLRWYGVGLLIGFCFLCACVGMAAALSVPTNLFLIGCFVAIAGFGVAGVFAYAGLYNIEDQKIVIASFYAADLLGGCLGSLLASMILIPLSGMDATAWAMLLLAAFSILLV